MRCWNRVLLDVVPEAAWRVCALHGWSPPLFQLHWRPHELVEGLSSFWRSCGCLHTLLRVVWWCTPLLSVECFHLSWIEPEVVRHISWCGYPRWNSQRALDQVEDGTEQSTVWVTCEHVRDMLGCETVWSSWWCKWKCAQGQLTSSDPTCWDVNLVLPVGSADARQLPVGPECLPLKALRVSPLVRAG